MSVGCREGGIKAGDVIVRMTIRKVSTPPDVLTASLARGKPIPIVGDRDRKEVPLR